MPIRISDDTLFFMRHFILLSYILIFSTGFASLAGLVVLRLHLRSAFTKRMMLVQAIFIANLGMVAIYFYFSQVLGLVGNNQTLDSAFALSASFLNIALYGALLYLLRSLKKHTAQKFAYIASCSGCIATMVLLSLSLVGAFLFADAELGWIVKTQTWSLFAYLCIALTMGFSGYLLFSAPEEPDHTAYKTLLRGIGICLLAFVPLGLLEFFLSSYTDFAYQPLSLEYVVYLGMNIFILVASIQVLVKEPKSETSFSTISDASYARFSLTAREREMVGLIAKGMTNKEIAFSCGISEATVRTHIYNLFQKVGAQSRIELLNLLHD